MDTNSNKQNAKKEHPDDSVGIGYVFQSPWIRCSLRYCDEVDRILLDNRWNFLLPISTIFWSILLGL